MSDSGDLAAAPGNPGAAGAVVDGSDAAGSGSDGAVAADAVRRASVIVASTSGAAGRSEDRTGPVIAAWLRDRGFAVDGPAIVADGEPVGEAVRAAVAEGAAVVITTGGTGVSPSDLTPEVVAPLLDVQLPGIIEEVRRRGLAATPMAVITRGIAGFAGPTLIVTLPGSPGGVRDGLAVLGDVLEHVIAQRTGPASRH